MARRINNDNFDEAVLENALPVVVEFYSDSCRPCKMMAPVLGELEEYYEGQIEVVKVNTNFERDLCEEYDIMSNPTFIVFINGKAADRKTGLISYGDLETWLQPYIWKH